jgi:hypothetical protein
MDYNKNTFFIQQPLFRAVWGRAKIGRPGRPKAALAKSLALCACAPPKTPAAY